MHSKKGYLITNPHGGQDMTRFQDIMTVFAAAGWKVENVLVEYGGQEKTLAEKAIPDGYELLIAHGGDGTVSKVMEAVVMASQEQGGKGDKSDKTGKGNRPVVGAISGGTANQWVHEIGYPTDPVQAALALINSDVRLVDVGRISVERVVFPAAQHQKQKTHNKAHKKNARYFLLTAGFGIDAAIISHTSKTLKQRIGSLAYEVAATKELPTQHPFYVEIFPVEKDASTGTSTHTGNEQKEQDGQAEQREQKKQATMEQAWRGKAIQVVVGNTRRYGDELVLNPNAYIDDGKLDICIMTDANALKMTQQVASLLLRKRPDTTETVALQDVHFTITLPAHIEIQLDGGSVKLHDFLSASEQDALEHQTDPSQVLVTYRIDVMPQAVAVAVPRTYDNTLFSQPSRSLNTSPMQQKIDTSLPDKVLTEQTLTQGQIDALIPKSQLITVVGVTPDPAFPQSYIIAGTTRKTSTEDVVPVAMRINAETPIHTQSGEPRLPRDLQSIQPGSMLHVLGKMNKRGVIAVDHLIV